MLVVFPCIVRVTHWWAENKSVLCRHLIKVIHLLKQGNEDIPSVEQNCWYFYYCTNNSENGLFTAISAVFDLIFCIQILIIFSRFWCVAQNYKTHSESVDCCQILTSVITSPTIRRWIELQRGNMNTDSHHSLSPLHLPLSQPRKGIVIHHINIIMYCVRLGIVERQIFFVA